MNGPEHPHPASPDPPAGSATTVLDDSAPADTTLSHPAATDGDVDVDVDVDLTVDPVDRSRRWPGQDTPFGQAFDLAPLAIALIDARAGQPPVILRANRAFGELVGRPCAEVVGRVSSDLIESLDALPPEWPRFAPEGYGDCDAIVTGRSDIEHRIHGRVVGEHGGPGGQRWLSMSVSMVRDAHGQPDYMVAHLVDVSEIRRAQAEVHRTATRNARIAAVLQQSLVPFVPRQVGPLRTAHRYRACGDGTLVGGDWCDVFALPGGRIGFVIGDVAGHGIESAATMTRLRTLVRMLATSGLRPAGVMRRLNEVMIESDVGSDIDLATLVHGQLDAATGVFLYCSAGHLPMFVLPPAAPPASDRRDQRHRGDLPDRPRRRGRLGTTGHAVHACPIPAVGGPPIGAVPDITFREQAAALAPGSRLIGFTDGLVETRDRDLDQALLNLFTGVNQLPADVVDDVEALADALLDLSPGTAAEDDVALLVIGFEPVRITEADARAIPRSLGLPAFRPSQPAQWPVDPLRGVAPAPERVGSLPIGTEVALLDRSGTIVEVNEAWDRFALANGGDLSRTGVGRSYLRICDQAGDPLSHRVGEAIRTAIRGDLPAPMTITIPCDSPDQARLFDLLISSRVDNLGRCLGASVTVSLRNSTRLSHATGGASPLR